MKSFMTSKSQPQHPASPARVYDAQSSEESESKGKKSKIPRLPKRTYSLEGNKSSPSSSKTSNSQCQGSNFSLIPRLECRKNNKKPTLHNASATKKPKTATTMEFSRKNFQSESQNEEVDEIFFLNSSLQNKIQEDFINFTNNVLRIPEYCTDTGQTLTAVLENSINIVKKKYPSADVETFEAEVKNIVKTTEAVKQKIFTKTDKIISHANKIYFSANNKEKPKEENIKKIEEQMENLGMEALTSKDIFGDLLSCGSEIMQLVDSEQILKKKVSTAELDDRRGEKMDQTKAAARVPTDDPISSKQSTCELQFSLPSQSLKNMYVIQSCGDVLNSSSNFPTASVSDSATLTQAKSFSENKFTQTINLTTAQLYKQEEDLTNLNNLVLDLHQLCKDHVAKFKNFNLQIKLRGICKKAQNVSSKEIQKHIDENQHLTEKNNQLQNYNKDLEAAIKQRDHNIQQKDRLINQQKKLLNVRDELIEMLKSKCKIDETYQ